MAPSWSSFPQRPQLESSFIQFSTSAWVKSWCSADPDGPAQQDSWIQPARTPVDNSGTRKKALLGRFIGHSSEKGWVSLKRRRLGGTPLNLPAYFKAPARYIVPKCQMTTAFPSILP